MYDCDERGGKSGQCHKRHLSIFVGSDGCQGLAVPLRLLLPCYATSVTSGAGACVPGSHRLPDAPNVALKRPMASGCKAVAMLPTPFGSVYLLACLCACLSICQSGCLAAWLFGCLAVWLFVMFCVLFHLF